MRAVIHMRKLSCLAMLFGIVACGSSTAPKLPVAVGTYVLTSFFGGAPPPYLAKFADSTTFTVVADTLVVSSEQWVTQDTAAIQFSRVMARPSGQSPLSYSGTGFLGVSGGIEFRDPDNNNFALKAGNFTGNVITASTVAGVAMTFTRVK